MKGTVRKMRLTLARLRESMDMSQTKLSKLAGVSQGYYSDIESGIKCPSPAVAARIAKVLCIRGEDMFRVFYSGDETV